MRVSALPPAAWPCRRLPRMPRPSSGVWRRASRRASIPSTGVPKSWPSGCRGDRRQVPDPGLCRWRDRSRAGGLRCGQGRYRRNGAHGFLLFFRQGSDLRAGNGGSLRHDQPPDGRLDALRQWRQADRRVVCQVEYHGPSPAATPRRRWAAGTARRSRRLPTSRG
jgi:hypothetical protein